MNKRRLYELLEKYFDKKYTPAEKSELFQLLAAPENETVVKEWIDGGFSKDLNYEINPESADDILQAILTVNPGRDANGEEENGPGKPGGRLHFLRTAWFRYAAAVILLIGVAITAIVVSSDRPSRQQSLTNGNKQLQTDVPPGGEKAVLTLAGGTKIILDDAVNGQLANEGGVKIVKLANGQIAYDVKGLTDKDIMWNTMSTPAGGQYQVTLPDGSKVWLNATSSITYPAAFISKNRLVKVSGEAYFEVVRDKHKPFIVDVDGKADVQVLGTIFNVNSYRNEETIKTTLVEGSVRIFRVNTAAIASSSDLQQKPNQTSVVLKPGQQAQIAGSITVKSDTDLAQTLAWKNGLFSFDNSDLPSVMRQLERWYDIKVKYQGNVSDLTLRGEMYRNVNLSTVLDFLKKMGINVRLEGKTLIVL